MAKAIAAQQFAQVRQHGVISVEVYAAIDPRSAKVELRVPAPLLADWIERWLRRKIDVAATTHAEYARLLRRRVVPDLENLRLGEISRTDHLDEWKACLASTLSAATVHKLWVVLSGVVRDAVPRYRPDNPLARRAGQRGIGLRSRGPRCDLRPPISELRVAVSVCGCARRLHKRPRFHDLRHPQVAYLIDAVWDFYMIQLWRGHASIKTTFDIYGHLLPYGEP